MFSRIFGRKSKNGTSKTGTEKTNGTTPPSSHTVVVNYENWSPPGPNDVRSPCPAINALANHNILPHNGKSITKAQAIEALTKGLNVDPSIAHVFALSGIFANPHQQHDNDDPNAPQTFDLNHVSKHNYIEHDCSLSRDDAAFPAGAEKFSAEAWGDVLEVYRKAHGVEAAGGEKDAEIKTDWGTAGKARWARVKASKEKHEREGKAGEWRYGIKEAVMSYGETGLYLGLLGVNGVAPLEWVRVFFEQERLPFKEGWRLPTTPITQAGLNHAYAEMLKDSDHGAEEASWVGMGTLSALKAAVLGLGAGILKAPSAFFGGK